MRKLPLSCLLLAVLASACSKDKTEDPQPTVTNTFKYTYSGTAFDGDAATISALKQDNDSSLLISGFVGTQHSVTLTLYHVVGTGAGVYSLKKASGSAVTKTSSGVFRMPASGASSWTTLLGPSATNGTITVSEFDRASQHIKGTFTITAAGALAGTGATGTKSVTNGSFDVTGFH